MFFDLIFGRAINFFQYAHALFFDGELRVWLDMAVCGQRARTL